MQDGARLEYFIGANTAKGFVNYASELYAGLRKVYILKGGPGTGKSTLMRRVAEAAERKGITVERHFCSSDSDSLDGVILRELSAGITDGTSPHVMEARCPGAREEILDPGAFWDARLLEGRCDEIASLTDRKAGLYASIYKYLAVGAALRGERDRILASCIDGDKLERAAARLIRRLGEGKGFALLPRQIGSLGMKGRVFLDTYETMAKERWQISDTRGLRGLLLNVLLRHAERAGLTVMISYDPMGEPEGLFFPEAGVSVTERGDAEAADKILNTERFVLREGLSEQRGRLRFLTRMERDILSRVTELFREVEACHFALEAIYADAMDYAGVDAMTERLIRRLGL